MAVFAQVTKSWVHSKAQKFIKARDSNGVMRVYQNGCTPFRGVMNNQDPLHRVDYKCDGKKYRKRWYEICDGTNVPTVSGNVKHVWTGGEYVRFRKGKEYLRMQNMRRHGKIEHPIDTENLPITHPN